MGAKKPNYLDEYKELGLKVYQDLAAAVIAECPFHGDKHSPTLLVSKATGEHRCSDQTCVASRTGDINVYCDLVFGKKISRTELISGDNLAKIHTNLVEEKIRAIQDPTAVALADAGKAEYIGRKISFRATSSGKDLQPYASPKEVTLTCKMGLKVCGACSIGVQGGAITHSIPVESPDVIRMIDVNEDQLKEFMRRSAGIYPRCPRFDMKVEEHYSVEDIRLMPEISFSADTNSEYTVKQAYHVGHGIKTNATYEFEGISVADPKDQHITMQLTKAKPVQDSIESFKLSPEMYEKLKIFQLRRSTDSIEEKLNGIANDLSTNVTHIYRRSDLIIAIDLIYHSVLYFNFQKKQISKGWTECLIIGDTRCGKTETITSLVKHYRAGEISTGENCSFAGIVGGLQQIGSRWSIGWGKLPLNDKRLFVIDEVSGMSIEDIGRMSGVRSSGLAEITKVQTERTFARTRIIWVANPRSSRPLGSYDTGVQAIPELMGRPEDTARFDFAIGVMSGDVPLDVVNSQDQATVPHLYTSELCSKLVAWAWSRKPENIIITKEAEKLCLELSLKMGSMYSAAIPLVEPAEFRIKLIRLSVACAARVFSTLNGEDLIVDVGHIQFVFDYLNRIYSQPSMNYLAFSKARIQEQQLKDSSVVEVIIKSHGPSLIEGLLGQQYFRLQDFEDLFDMEKKELKGVISQLVRNRAIKHYNTVYVKTPAFITLLRKAQAIGVAEKLQPSKEVDY